MVGWSGMDCNQESNWYLNWSTVPLGISLICLGRMLKSLAPWTERLASLALGHTRGLARVLSNKYNPATPWTCKDGDTVALNMTLEDFPDKDNTISFSSAFLAVHPEKF